MYYVQEEANLDEEFESMSSHRCSMVKRYNLPTFFTPGKHIMELSDEKKPYQHHSPYQVSM